MRSKCLGVFLVFITIPLICLSIFLLGAQKMTHAKFYKELFSVTRAYENVTKIIPKETDNEFLQALYSSINKDWLKVSVETNLDEYFKYVTGKTKRPNFSIDASTLKQNLPSMMSQDLKSQISDKLTLQGYIDFMKNNQAEMLKNAKSNAKSQEELKSLEQQIKQMGDIEQQMDKNLSSMRRSYHYTIFSIYAIYVLTLLMLCVIALAARRWIPAIFRWVGVTVFIGGVLSFSFSFLSLKIAQMFNPFEIIKMSTELRDLLKPIYLVLLEEVFSDAGKIGVLVAIIGLVSLITSYILPKWMPFPDSLKPKPKPAQPQPQSHLAPQK